ncbi:MAG: hypothetical protein Q7T17_02500 [Microbacterium sp.]|uniref:hypothetical protein n=1 Tax=Microbacterium sp. TaxID=51671 RepID=UPI002728FADF|nr:hypothetical protein [Microbacterium sp.]MDO8381840.1 hypothetical protein [Microbacterium sp.]
MAVQLSLDEWEDLTAEVGMWAMWSHPTVYRYPGPQVSGALTQQLDSMVDSCLDHVREDRQEALRDAVRCAIADPTRGRQMLHDLTDVSPIAVTLSDRLSSGTSAEFQ